MGPGAKAEAAAHRGLESVGSLVLRRRSKEPPAMVVQITTTAKDYIRFQDRARVEHLEQDEVLRRVLMKGMKSFNSQRLADMAEDYEWLKEQFGAYKADHEVLARLFSQNRELMALLGASK